MPKLNQACASGYQNYNTSTCSNITLQRIFHARSAKENQQSLINTRNLTKPFYCKLFSDLTSWYPWPFWTSKVWKYYNTPSNHSHSFPSTADKMNVSQHLSHDQKEACALSRICFFIFLSNFYLHVSDVSYYNNITKTSSVWRFRKNPKLWHSK